MRKLTVLGSTGSIGTQTLEVARKNPEDFTVVALSCNSDIDLLFEQIKEFAPKVCAVSNESAAEKLRERLKSENINSTEVLAGYEANAQIATIPECDTVVGAMVGISGLLPTYEAIKAGKDIALANKETLVTGGEVIMPLVKEKGVELLPVDSEHCAIWQCLKGEKHSDLDRILLTASGGPFRGKAREDLTDVTVDMALSHPTWKMGGKITIDSATMMNKGLEVIEASHLFSVPVDKIDIVVHPQSIIHSMIRLKDGSVLAQMGNPSMILPIMVALYYPERGPELIEDFDPFAKGANNLTFEPCDTNIFGLVKLAYDLGRAGGLMPTVMNAANEIAVGAFLKGKIRFLDIEKTVFEVCDKTLDANGEVTVESILETDRKARDMAKDYIKGIEL